MRGRMRHSRRRVLRAMASLLGARLLLRGQQETPTFSTEVNVVNVLATVTDHKGAIVRDLAQDEFLLLEDKRPQTIRYFSRETDLPLTLGLMVDTSTSQTRVLDAERGASFRFLEVVLRPRQDRVFLMQFDFRIFIRQPLTASLKQLNDSLAFVDTPARSQFQLQTGGGTLLYDAVVQISGKLMQPQQGRKAFIVLSDGVDNGSQQTLGRAIKASLVADTLIYSILFADPHGYGGGNRRGPGGGGRWGPPRHEHIDGKTVLQLLSKETGGGFFEVTKTEPLSLIYLRIQEELRNQYSVGYTPDRVDISAGYHKIRLTVRKKGMVVRTRDGYYAGQ